MRCGYPSILPNAKEEEILPRIKKLTELVDSAVKNNKPGPPQDDDEPPAGAVDEEEVREFWKDVPQHELVASRVCAIAIKFPAAYNSIDLNKTRGLVTNQELKRSFPKDQQPSAGKLFDSAMASTILLQRAAMDPRMLYMSWQFSRLT